MKTTILTVRVDYESAQQLLKMTPHNSCREMSIYLGLIQVRVPGTSTGTYHEYLNIIAQAKARNSVDSAQIMS